MAENPIDVLTSLSVHDTVRITTTDGTTDGVLVSKLVKSDRMIMLVCTGSHDFKIETQWMQGWLAPLVDVFDTSEPEEGFEPVGTLTAIEREEATPEVTLSV